MRLAKIQRSVMYVLARLRENWPSHISWWENKLTKHFGEGNLAILYWNKCIYLNEQRCKSFNSSCICYRIILKILNHVTVLSTQNIKLKMGKWEFSGGLVARIPGFHCCVARVQSLVGKRRSCKPCGMGKKNNKGKKALLFEI